MLYNPKYEKYISNNTCSENKFTTTHLVPKLEPNEKQKVKKDIEGKLFEIFKKYV